MHTTYIPSNKQVYQLKKPSQFKKQGAIVAIAIALSLSGCSSMTTRDKNTAIGAGVGAVAGAVLSGGNAWGIVGGAAVGGVIGNQVGKHK